MHLRQCGGVARTDARSDHAVLDFLGTFCVKTKGANKNLLLAITPQQLSCIQHPKHIYSPLTVSKLCT